VAEVLEGPAQRAGLRSGDTIVAVDGKSVIDGMALIEAVRGSQGRTLALSALRGGVPFEARVTPQLDSAGKAFVIKVGLTMAPEQVTVSAAPLEALNKALAKTWDMSSLTFKMIGKMITGEVSLKNVTGPITIADYAGQTARMGPEVYLGFIAFFSISLGVMNLLPIPMLDGGLLLYYSLEVLTGRPLPERIGAYLQRAGVGLLVMLMALAVFNDVARLL
jgi:regulator of sigma E protease